MKVCAWLVFAVLALALVGSGQRMAVGGDKTHEHGHAFAACAKACADCSNSCASCYEHCASMVAQGKKEHVRTMTLCNDCAEVCSTAAKLTSRRSPFSTIICEACAKTCDDC